MVVCLGSIKFRTSSSIFFCLSQGQTLLSFPPAPMECNGRGGQKSPGTQMRGRRPLPILFFCFYMTCFHVSSKPPRVLFSPVCRKQAQTPKGGRMKEASQTADRAKRIPNSVSSSFSLPFASHPGPIAFIQRDKTKRRARGRLYNLCVFQRRRMKGLRRWAVCDALEGPPGEGSDVKCVPTPPEGSPARQVTGARSL